jgi:hypothetical protein
MWARQFADGRPNVVSRRPRKIERKLSRLRYWPWFRGKQFTTDWTSENFTIWRRVLSPLRKKPLRILEIGSWEGRSALFFLNFFPHATITCIDTFEGGHGEPTEFADKVPGIQERFDHNLAPFGSRTEKLKCLSHEVFVGWESNSADTTSRTSTAVTSPMTWRPIL